jgi:hypothetical protein
MMPVLVLLRLGSSSRTDQVNFHRSLLFGSRTAGTLSPGLSLTVWAGSRAPVSLSGVASDDFVEPGDLQREIERSRSRGDG